MKKIKNILKTYIKQNKSFEINKDVIRYIIFVIIATIFWFLNSLSKDYTTLVSYPINYTNIPKDKVLIKELPKELTLEVKGYGFALLRYKISTAFLPITFNVNKYTNNILIKNNILNHIIYTNNIKNKIASKLSKDIKLISISPDTIGLHFSKIITKRLPIKAQTSINYAKQYSQNADISVFPDSVTIYAPSTITDTLKFVNTEPLIFNKLDKSIKRNISLQKIRNVKFETQRTVVNIPVDQFIETNKEIKITVLNIPDSLTLRLFPDKIKVSYRVGLSNFNNTKENDFAATVDYKHLSKHSNKLKVNLHKYPKHINRIQIQPSKVEYIIEKKKQ